MGLSSSTDLGKALDGAGGEALRVDVFTDVTPVDELADDDLRLAARFGFGFGGSGLGFGGVGR